MRLPRDVSGDDLVDRLGEFDYHATRQTGSHLRLTTSRNGEHHVTVPRHGSLRVGTLSAILRDVSEHLGIDREALIKTLFGRSG